MGYRHYFLKINIEELNKIRKLTKDELTQFCADNNLIDDDDIDDDYIYFGDILDFLKGKEVFGFGKYYENAEAIMELGTPLFENKDNRDRFCDYDPYVVSKEAVLCAIEWQKQKIVNYFNSLLMSDEEYAKRNFGETIPKEKRLEKEIQSKLDEWTILTPYNLDSNRPNLINSWLYEYSIFDLVRIYKDTNWKEDCLIFYGY